MNKNCAWNICYDPFHILTVNCCMFLHVVPDPPSFLTHMYTHTCMYTTHTNTHRHYTHAHSCTPHSLVPRPHPPFQNVVFNIACNIEKARVAWGWVGYTTCMTHIQHTHTTRTTNPIRSHPYVHKYKWNIILMVHPPLLHSCLCLISLLPSHSHTQTKSIQSYLRLAATVVSVHSHLQWPLLDHLCDLPVVYFCITRVTHRHCDTLMLWTVSHVHEYKK